MYKHILVPMDMSPAAEAALGIGAGIARQWRADLTLLTVVPDYGYAVVAQYFSDEDQQRARREARAQLDALVVKHNLGDLACIAEVRKGRIYEEIILAAEEHGVDLIVIATHSGDGFERFLMGSNAEKVAHYARCSVLIVRGNRGA